MDSDAVVVLCNGEWDGKRGVLSCEVVWRSELDSKHK
jgi:hypothetical protein